MGSLWRAVLPVALLLGGCARFGEPLPDTIRAEVLRVMTPGEFDREAPLLIPTERAVRRNAQMDRAVIEGRVVRLRCALGPENAIIMDALLPERGVAEPGEVIRAMRGRDGAWRFAGSGSGTPGLVRGELPAEAAAAISPAWLELHYATVRARRIIRCEEGPPPRVDRG